MLRVHAIEFYLFINQLTFIKKKVTKFGKDKNFNKINTKKLLIMHDWEMGKSIIPSFCFANKHQTLLYSLLSPFLFPLLTSQALTA